MHNNNNMSNNNNRSALMIKLAPSPRDRSFRSQTSNTISSPRGSNCSLSPRSGSDGLISPRSNNTTVAHNNRHHRRNRSNGSNESPEISKSSYNSKNVIHKNKLPVSPRCTPRETRIILPGGGSPGVREREEQRGVISPPIQQQHVTIASVAGVNAAISNSYSGAPTYESSNDNIKSMERQISASSGVKVSTKATNKASSSTNIKPTYPAIDNNSTAQLLTPADKRTKRMLVVDPKSGRKYHLDEDDHSLTDKVLHVYHKKGLAARQKKAKEKKLLEREQQAMKANNRTREEKRDTNHHTHARIQSDAAVLALPQHTKSLSLEEQTLNTLSTYNTLPFNDEHTLETASALTEVSYYGRYKFNQGGPLECLIPSSCKSLEQLALASEMDGKVREMRDDVESIERTRYEALLSATTGKEGKAVDNTNLGPLSPLSTAFQAITSSFFQTNNGIIPESAGMKEIKFRRMCLVVFPDEVQSSLGITSKKKKRKNDNGVGLLGMKFVQSNQDFQAHVSYVQRGSKADRMGVRKGDIVSFAVALSNMTEEQNSFLAEKLIKRLESVGMRTSYRELYDIFLSKTTNCRPIGLVFRRWRGDRASCLTSGVSAKDIDNEFEWSSDFLQSLAIKCREYEFEQKVPLSMDAESDHANEQKGRKGGTESNNLLTTFLPRPNVDTSPAENGLVDYVSSMLNNLSCGNYGSPEIRASSSREQLQGNSLDFLSNRMLCSLVEQSLGLIFLRRTGKTSSSGMFATSGSGFIVARKAEGSWSAPCFLTILGSKERFTDHANDTSPVSDDVKMIVIRKNDMINNLIQGKPIKFSVHKEERANALVRDSTVIGVEEGRFTLTDDFFLAVKVNDEQNLGAYSSSTDHLIEASDILKGTISPPEQSVDFYGALQSLELPYSMHSHPVIPDVLSQFSDSDWCELSSNCGLRTKLQMISEGNLPDDKNEVDIFVRKFKYYLMDGVPLHQILSPGVQGLTEEQVLRMTINDPGSLFSSILELTRKRIPGVSNVGQSNFSTSFESITKLSRSPPLQVLSMLDEEKLSRFFSVETDLTPVPVMMLAKSKKDAMILLCGLKLLLEKEKMCQSS